MRLDDIFGTPIIHGNVHIDVIAGDDDATKAITDGPDTFGLRPDELALPDALPDPGGMRFTDEQIAALTETDNDAAKALAFGTAGPEKKELLKAKEEEGSRSMASGISAAKCG